MAPVGESVRGRCATTALPRFFRDPIAHGGTLRGMRRDPLERLSIRAALALGFGLLMALWVIAGWSFSARLTDLEAQTTAITARYIDAQDALTTIRTQLNVSSIILRDALLDTRTLAQGSYEDRIAGNYATIIAAIDDYEPVLDTDDWKPHVERLRREVEAFWDTTRIVLHQPDGADRVALLNDQIAPRRAAALAMSDEIRTLNRRALLQHQTAVNAIHREIQSQWYWRVGLALVTGLGIALLAVVYAGRLEDRLRRQRARDRQSAHELQQLSARLVAAQEEERRSIARELHDEVGQVLSAIKVDLSMAQRALEQQGVDGRALDEPQQMADTALRTVRDLSQLLRPSVLDDLGLAPAVEALLRGMARRQQVQATLQQDGPVPRLDPATEVAAFRIIQEALTNVARHADARRCTVRLSSDGRSLTLGIDDDGRGFDPTAIGRAGVGLIGLRERVAERGGTLQLITAPGQGTRLTVRLPVADADGTPAAIEQTGVESAVPSLPPYGTSHA